MGRLRESRNPKDNYIVYKINVNVYFRLCGDKVCSPQEKGRVACANKAFQFSPINRGTNQSGALILIIFFKKNR